MSISLRKHAAMFLAATFTVGSMATFGAAALDQPTAVLSSTLNHSVGTVLTSAEISNAQQAMAKAKASALKAQQDAAKKAQEEAAKKAKAEAAKKAAEEAAKKEAEIKAAATKTAYNQLVASAATARPVAYSTTYLASDAIKANATALGNYKLTFYDPCVECNGNNLALTATGTTLTLSAPNSACSLAARPLFRSAAAYSSRATACSSLRTLAERSRATRSTLQ